MTAEKLIALLMEIPPETKIFIWTTDGREEISKTLPLDYWGGDEKPTADINVDLRRANLPFDPISSGTTEI